MASYPCPFGYAALLDHLLGNAGITVPATWYVGLCTAPASSNGLLTDANGNAAEVSGNGYTRVAVANNLVNFPLAVRGEKTNGTSINFPRATGAWGLVLSAFLADAPSGGNVWRHWDLVTPCSPVNGSVALSFPIGNLWFVR